MIILLSGAGPSFSSTSGYPLGKQDEKLETWSFHSKIDLPGTEKALYIGMFFCSGKLYFLKGNFAHIFWLDTSTGKYTFENNIFLPPLEKVIHCEKSLNEKYHESFFRYNSREKSILTYASLSNFCSKLTFYPEKTTFDYNQVCQYEPAEKTFDWYMFPRLNIEAVVNGGYDLCTTGEGHFQHFWGDKIDESGDFIVAHLDSGYDIIVNDVYSSEDESSRMPNEYILLSDPDGNIQKISDFKYSVREWAESGNKGKRYPVHISVTSEERDLNLNVRVFKKDQTANLLGVEKWFGYADINGSIDKKPQKGWAFFSPIGIRKE